MIDRLIPTRRILLCLFLLLATAAGVAPNAVAEEPARDSVMTGLSQKVSKDRFDATFEFVGAPRSRLLILRHPDRIAVDLFDTVAAIQPAAAEANGLVSGIRHGLVAPDRYRVIFTLARPGVPTAETETRDGHTRIRLSIAASDAASLDRAAPSQQIGEGAPTAAGPVAANAAEAAKRFTVVIDPGHGGVDTGAIGKHGTQEKDVNLRFALALRDALKPDPRIDVLMTRSDDTFISLGQRSEIARKAKADLFISMHADSIRYADIRGATVYTLSERASDQLSREIAESENSADRFVDPGWRENRPEVFDILVELMRRETDSFSQHFAAGLVQEFGRHDIRLIRNPRRSAGFKVLTAPDVPSVLVEIGYLSNVDDEQLLLDGSWRDDTAKAIAAAVSGFLGTAGASREAKGG